MWETKQKKQNPRRHSWSVLEACCLCSIPGWAPAIAGIQVLCPDRHGTSWSEATACQCGAAERRWCYYIGGMLWWRPPIASFLGSRSQSLEEEVGVLSFEAPELAGHYRRHIASQVSKYLPCAVPATADPGHKCWGGEGKFRNETGQVSVTINNAAEQTEWTPSGVRPQRYSPQLWCHHW